MWIFSGAKQPKFKIFSLSHILSATKQNTIISKPSDSLKYTDLRILGIFPPKPLKLVGRVSDSDTNSVTDNRKGFPPKLVKSVEIASNLVAERSSFSQEKKSWQMQLVFTEFGLSSVVKMPSTEEISLSPAKLQTTPHSNTAFSLPKVKSPISQRQENMKPDNAAPKSRKRCHCQRSRCLKLYCECFASGAYCDGCDCHCCRNNVKNKAIRQAAMEIILERNPNAFRPKIASSPSSAQDHGDDMDSPVVGKHNWGCRCRKTGCLKNYCECFHAKVLCSKNCKCMDCKNTEEYAEKVFLCGSDYNNTKLTKNSKGHKKITVVPDEHNSSAQISKNFEVSEKNTFTNGGHCNINFCKHFEGSQEETAFPSTENNCRKICIQQANAAISAAVGLSGPSILQTSRKRKLQELLDSSYKDPSIQRLNNHQKVNPLRVSSSFSALSVDPIDNVSKSATQASLKFQCRARSAFADSVQAQMMEELCAVLVLTSEAGKDKDGASDVQAIKENQNSNISEVPDMKNFLERSNLLNETRDDYLSGNKDDSINTMNHISGGANVKEGRLLSPGNIALMCKEKDEAFIGASTPSQILIQGCKANVCIEQERLVLTSFRDCLKKIIILGNIKGQHGQVDNTIVKDGNQHE